MTEDMTKSIALYHNLFLACLILFFICLVTAALLFFLLHIADAVAYLTGRRARKQIEQMEKDNAASGRPDVLKSAPQGRRPMSGVTETLDSKDTPDTAVLFEVEREIILIHTDESISF